PKPPISTDAVAPNQNASNPALNSPNVLDVPVNIEFTAMTRPSMSFGVRVWTRECRMITLIESLAPMATKANMESTSQLDNPNTAIAAPNDMTVAIMIFPALRLIE